VRARSTASAWSVVQSTAILTELDRILRSPLFAQAERQRRFLEFIVTETLAGRADRISGYTVGIRVYDRDHGFEPMLDPIVRVEAGRLRAKLREYYDGDGQLDPIRIGLVKGSYAATIGAGGLALAGELSHAPNQGGSTAEKPSLVVLPFASEGNNPRQENVADEITEDLITDLSKLPLFLVSHHVSYTYRRTQKHPRTIGRDLGVRYLLEGSVRYAGGLIRVSAQLIDAASGQALWGARYDRKLGDDFAVQDEVTHNIVRAIRLRVTPQRAVPPRRKPLLPAVEWLLWTAYMALTQDPELLDIFGLSV
jgi:TolB-like protein